jgi:hypothetical protein
LPINAATCGCFGDLFSGPGQQHFWGQFTLDIVLATLLVMHVLLVRRLRRQRAAGAMLSASPPP